jgi:hypothetical protein
VELAVLPVTVVAEQGRAKPRNARARVACRMGARGPANVGLIGRRDEREENGIR